MSSSRLESTIRELVTDLGMKMKIILEDGLVELYNGIEFLQTRDYIKMHCSFYTDKILEIMKGKLQVNLKPGWWNQ